MPLQSILKGLLLFQVFKHFHYSDVFLSKTEMQVLNLQYFFSAHGEFASLCVSIVFQLNMKRILQSQSLWTSLAQ